MTTPTVFNPDWSLDDARRESLREHMAMVTDLARENERLRGIIRDGALAARHVLRVVDGQGSDGHEALSLLRQCAELVEAGLVHRQIKRPVHRS